MEKKLKLLEALEHERALFDKRHQDTTDHDMAINYLKHGVLPSIGVDQFELLDVVVNDFDMACLYYGV